MSLGITTDDTLSFNSHVTTFRLGAYNHVKTLRHVRKCLTDEDAKHIATALVTARLDNCNSLLYKTSERNLAKSQRVHNTLATLVANSRKTYHITPILMDYHWLPISARMDCKIAV
jgi:hypothetical protein